MLNLTKHAYAAEISGALIFLNVKRDSYTYLAPEDAAGILSMLGGVAGCNPGEIERSASYAGNGGSIVDELKLADLVTTDKAGKPFRPIRYDTVMNEQPRLIGPESPKIRAGHVWGFFWSVLLARTMLSWLPLHWVVGFVKKRRVPHAKTGNPHSAAQLTEIYRRLRPLLFSRSDRCLLDSLSLINFLRRYHVPASWCFGVRLEPFKAHAWVQDDHTIFDDMAANVHSFTVILEA